MYGYKKEFHGSFEAAYTQAVEELNKEGFGVLTEIDVQKTLKEKLDADFDRYKILGACNPGLAFQALKTEKEIGLLLPCNVVVFEDFGKVFVSAILPTKAMEITTSAALKPIAGQVEAKLKRVIDGIGK